MRPDGDSSHGAYADAGVDIDAAGRAVESIKKTVRETFGAEVLTGIGAFAGLFQLSGYREPVLVSSVDGVGTKLKIAIALDRHDTVGIDLVNHCVNDIFTCGADPLFFLDYISVGKLIPDKIASIVGGFSRACKDVGCALIGGETAEMPGLYAPGDYDLAGFIVGAVEKSRMLQTDSITAGDVILGLPSSGLHTNGYSLVRKVFGVDDNPAALGERYAELGRTLGEELLEPHRCYYGMLKPVVGGSGKDTSVIKGMAHITGGGIIDNVARVLPPGVTALFKSSSWLVPPIFGLIRERGSVDLREMYRVFNMGIGMTIVCSAGDVDRVIEVVPEAVVVGEVVPERDERVVVD